MILWTTSVELLAIRKKAFLEPLGKIIMWYQPRGWHSILEIAAWQAGYVANDKIEKGQG